MPIKILLVLVEGVSDDTALASLLQKTMKDHSVRVHIVKGDITSTPGVNVKNIESKVCEKVKDFAKTYKLKNSDFEQVIHIVDTDGTYISENHIIENDSLSDHIYTTSSILTPNKRVIELRNMQKSANLDKICSCNKIWGIIPYKVYYMSCNLDHVLYDEINLDPSKKNCYALDFNKKYRNDIEGFKEFILNSPFSVNNSYNESWEFIRNGTHSLERHTNIGLFFPK